MKLDTCLVCPSCRVRSALKTNHDPTLTGRFMRVHRDHRVLEMDSRTAWDRDIPFHERYILSDIAGWM